MYQGKSKMHKVGAVTMAYPNPQRSTLLGNVLETQFEYDGHQF